MKEILGGTIDKIFFVMWPNENIAVFSLGFIVYPVKNIMIDK
jgi:hypothetical protein